MGSYRVNIVVNARQPTVAGERDIFEPGRCQPTCVPFSQEQGSGPFTLVQCLGRTHALGGACKLFGT